MFHFDPAGAFEGYEDFEDDEIELMDNGETVMPPPPPAAGPYHHAIYAGPMAHHHLYHPHHPHPHHHPHPNPKIARRLAFRQARWAARNQGVVMGPHGPHGPRGPRFAKMRPAAAAAAAQEEGAFKKRVFRNDSNGMVSVSLDLPGVKAKDLAVKIVKTEKVIFLGVSGNRKRGEETFKFNRRLRLGKSLDLSELKAHLQDGVLLVTVPKIQTEEAGMTIEVLAEEETAPAALEIQMPSHESEENNFAMVDVGKSLPE